MAPVSGRMVVPPMTPADKLREMIREAEGLRAHLKREGPKFGVEACAAAIRASALREALKVGEKEDG